MKFREDPLTALTMGPTTSADTASTPRQMKETFSTTKRFITTQTLQGITNRTAIV